MNMRSEFFLGILACLIPSVVMFPQNMWQDDDAFFEDYRLKLIKNDLYVYGRGNIFQSRDGGQTWQETFRMMSSSADIAGSELWQENDTIVYEISGAFMPAVYFGSVDGKNWIRLSDKSKRIKSIIFSSIKLRPFTESGVALNVLNRIEFDSSAQVSIAETSEPGTSNKIFGVYRQNVATNSWSLVRDIPVVSDSAEPRYPWFYKKYVFAELRYLADEKIVLAYLEGEGLFRSCDSGKVWDRVPDVGQKTKIVGFCEWKEYVVIVLMDGSVIYLEKEKLSLPALGDNG